MASVDLPVALGAPSNAPVPPSEASGLLARMAERFTGWAERYIPDAFVFALVATFTVIGCAVAFTDTGILGIVKIWGDSFWELVAFTMQMAVVIITGYVVATAPVAYRLITRLATLPRSGRAAVAMVALFSMASAWLNWGFSLIFSAMLAKEVARRVQGVDYRALGASTFMGLGSIWAQGLSGSAALQMATGSALPASIRQIVAADGAIPGGVIGLRDTIFLWQSLVCVAVEVPIVTLLFYFATPTGVRARTAENLGIDLGCSPAEQPEPPRKGTPGEWLEHVPLLNVLFVLLSGAYFVQYFAGTPDVLAALNFNTINLAFLTVGVAAHVTPARLMRAVKEATPGVWAIILQYPFYAGIAAVISRTHLNAHLAAWFVRISSPTTLPALVAVYSAVLGIFVPSGGSKWVIEAPYVMRAAHELTVHLGWMVAVYDLGEALANLVQPFWMLPVLGLLGLRARDIMGYTFLAFLVLTPVVLILVTVLGATLPYPL